MSDIPIKDLPDDFGTEVPVVGSKCANCLFFSEKDDVGICTNKTFIQWAHQRLKLGNGKKPVEIPAPDGDPRRYCCSAWQAAKGVLDKPEKPSGEPVVRTIDLTLVVSSPAATAEELEAAIVREIDDGNIGVDLEDAGIELLSYAVGEIEEGDQLDDGSEAGEDDEADEEEEEDENA